MNKVRIYRSTYPTNTPQNRQTIDTTTCSGGRTIHNIRYQHLIEGHTIYSGGQLSHIGGRAYRFLGVFCHTHPYYSIDKRLDVCILS